MFIGLDKIFDFRNRNGSLEETFDVFDFLDKLEKDVMFSSGKYISRSLILQDMAELLAKTKLNATGIKDNLELKTKMQEAIAKLNQEQKNTPHDDELKP